MNCATARELIEAYVDGELDPATKAEAQEHWNGCVDCAGIFARLRKLSDDIRAQAPYYDTPAGLEQRIHNALRPVAAEPPAAWRWIAVAASALLAISLAWNFALFRAAHGDRETVAQNLVASHVRSLIGDHLIDVPSSDQHTVKPWFNGRVDFAPDVKDLTGSGFPLVGGRVDYIAGKTVAALVYKRRQHVINLFVWPSGPPGNASSEVVRQGYNIVHWDQAGLDYWAISDVSLADLNQFRTLYRQP
jgi:anti-sigma factor RsiW